MLTGQDRWRRTSTAARGSEIGRLVPHLLLLLAATLTATLFAAAAVAAEPGDVVWRDFAQRTEGGSDAYAACAVTPGGRVCAVGTTAVGTGAPADVLVKVFAPDGAVLWRRAWTWPGRSHDSAAAVARDRRGAFVVAGTSGTRSLLLKYSPSGYLQWVRRSNAGFTRTSFAAVTVDGSNNIYVTGEAVPFSGGRRLLLRKYAPSGALRWQRTLWSDKGDVAAAALVASGGELYVTGTMTTGLGRSTVATVKYSSSGVRRWVRYFSASPEDAARATGIAFAGGPVVAGFGGPAGGATHGFAVRYDTTGAQLWVAVHPGAGDTDDRFDAVLAGAAGVVVTGSRTLAGVSEMITLKFDAGGVLAWQRVTPGATGGTALCSVEGGVLSAGGTAAGFADRLSVAGAPLWLGAAAPEGYTDFHVAAAQAAGSGYLYVAGSATRGAGGTAATLVRYTP